MGNILGFRRSASKDAIEYEESDVQESASMTAKQQRGAAAQNAQERAINDIVDRYMKSSLNSPLLPDAVERALYKNMLRMTIGILSDTMNTSSVDILGHKLTLKMVPS